MWIQFWLPTSIAVLALLLSGLTWRARFFRHRLDVADQLLLEIHKIEIEHPDFVDHEYCDKALQLPNRDEKLRYEAFAAIVWNAVETIYVTYRKRTLQRSSFMPAMRRLAKRHRAWICVSENRKCYKSKMLKMLKV